MMNIPGLMNKDAYIEEHDAKSEEIKRIKRYLEFQSWIQINEAAVNIQRIFKGCLEKDYLLKFLEDKYQKDMNGPSLKLQAIYR